MDLQNSLKSVDFVFHTASFTIPVSSCENEIYREIQIIDQRIKIIIQTTMDVIDTIYLGKFHQKEFYILIRFLEKSLVSFIKYFIIDKSFHKIFKEYESLGCKIN